MSDQFDVVKKLASDFRYGTTLISVFLIGLLLLFFEDLTEPITQVLFPSLIIYTTGSALIALVQTLFTASANTKALSDGTKPRGISEKHLTIVVVVHILWFILFLAYNAFNGIICLKQSA